MTQHFMQNSLINLSSFTVCVFLGLSRFYLTWFLKYVLVILFRLDEQIVLYCMDLLCPCFIAWRVIVVIWTPWLRTAAPDSIMSHSLRLDNMRSWTLNWLRWERAGRRAGRGIRERSRHTRRTKNTAALTEPGWDDVTDYRERTEHSASVTQTGSKRNTIQCLQKAK